MANDHTAQQPTLRLPVSRAQGERIYRRWDRLNGRYYTETDLVLDDDTLLQDVTCDSDTRVALLIKSRKLWNYPQLLGRQVVRELILTPATTAAERARFAENTTLFSLL
jgi:hypothetical protein